MRKVILFFILILSFKAMGQNQVSTLGTDFWLAYMTNWHHYDVDTFRVTIAAPQSCNCTISNPLTGWSHIISAPSNSATNYIIPNAQCNPTGSCVTQNIGLHITSDQPVQVYAFNHSGTASTGDATILYSTESLGSEYIVQTYPFTASTADAKAEFSILAIEDNTTIDIIFQGSTSTGIASGTTQTITLNAGQVYQVQSPSNPGSSDFSGTVVTTEAHGCTPFALFMGNTVTNVPSGNNTSSDHTYTQALPTMAWQKEWLLIQPAWYNNAIVRVTAKDSNTQVYVNNSLVQTLQRGQTYEYSFTDYSHLRTTHPCQVLQYLSSRYSGFGDASSFPPSPLNSRTQSSIFPTYTQNTRNNITNKYYLSILCPSTQASHLRLDGSSISATPTNIPGSPYCRINIPISYVPNGQHMLTTTGPDGFSAFTYGLAENWESYAMSLGGTCAIQTQIDTVFASTCNYPYIFHDLEFYQDGVYTLPINCHDSVRLILSFHDLDTTTVDTSACGNSFDYLGITYTSSGTYYSVLSANDTMCDSIIQLNLTLLPTYDTTIQAYSCDTLFAYGDSLIHLSDTVTHLLFQNQTQYGCDSIIRLEVHLLDNPYTEIHDGSCDSTYSYADTSLSVPGTYTFHLTSSHQCDSAVVLYLQLYPTYHFFTNDSFYLGEEYRWVNDIVFDQPTTTSLEFTTIHGCDSIYHLDLKGIVPSNPHIWVPNVFTPNLSENNTFRVYSDNIDEITVSIYNRWGDHVCTFDGLTSEWDGTYKGSPCPEASYVYYIRYHKLGSNEKPTPLFGTVTLIR